MNYTHAVAITRNSYRLFKHCAI